MKELLDRVGALTGTLLFFGFIAVKLVGHIFLAWSWWWVLLPIIPWLGHLVLILGL